MSQDIILVVAIINVTNVTVVVALVMDRLLIIVLLASNSCIIEI